MEARAPEWSQGRRGRLHRGGGAGAAACKRMRRPPGGCPAWRRHRNRACGAPANPAFPENEGPLFCWSVTIMGWEDGRRSSWSVGILYVFYSVTHLANVYWAATMYRASCWTPALSSKWDRQKPPRMWNVDASGKRQTINNSYKIT